MRCGLKRSRRELDIPARFRATWNPAASRGTGTAGCEWGRRWTQASTAVTARNAERDSWHRNCASSPTTYTVKGTWSWTQRSHLHQHNTQTIQGPCSGRIDPRTLRANLRHGRGNQEAGLGPFTLFWTPYFCISYCVVNIITDGFISDTLVHLCEKPSSEPPLQRLKAAIV